MFVCQQPTERLNPDTWKLSAQVAHNGQLFESHAAAATAGVKLHRGWARELAGSWLGLLLVESSQEFECIRVSMAIYVKWHQYMLESSWIFFQLRSFKLGEVFFTFPSEGFFPPEEQHVLSQLSKCLRVLPHQNDTGGFLAFWKAGKVRRDAGLVNSLALLWRLKSAERWGFFVAVPFLDFNSKTKWDVDSTAWFHLCSSKPEAEKVFSFQLGFCVNLWGLWKDWPESCELWMPGCTFWEVFFCTYPMKRDDSAGLNGPWLDAYRPGQPGYVCEATTVTATKMVKKSNVENSWKDWSRCKTCR